MFETVPAADGSGACDSVGVTEEYLLSLAY